MYLLTRKNRVIDYCEDGYMYVGNIVVCESKGTSYEDATIVYTDKELPADIDCFKYDYINGEFVANPAYAEEKYNGQPIGFQYFTTNPNIPTGCLPLFGGAFSRVTYKALWEWVQEQGTYLITEAEWQEKFTTNEGNVPYYSDGDGSTTFRVPSLKCWVKSASSIEKVGSYLKAGLPNITGRMQGFANAKSNTTDFSSYVTGAFNMDSQSALNSTMATGSGGNDTLADVSFDASRSSSIYGNSDTVQPPSIAGMWLVKAFGTVSNVGNQDLADISAGLTNVETRVTEVESTLDSSIAGISISGTTVTVTKNDGTTQTYTTQDTTYSAATTSTAGLMSASDKTKLNGLDSSGSGVFYATCSTAVGTTAKVATVTSGTFSLQKGVIVFLYITNTIKGGRQVTLNVNGSGAKRLYFNPSGTSWGTYSPNSDCDFYSTGNYVICVYDGTNWTVYSEVTYTSKRVGT